MRKISNEQKNKNAFCSICTLNHIAYAEVLNKSLRKVGYTDNHFVLIIDYKKEYKKLLENRNFIPVFLKDLKVPNINNLLSKFTAFELCNVLRPYLFKWLLKNKKIHTLVYLDTDIYLFSRLSKLFEFLDRNKKVSVVVTPHIIEPQNFDSENNYESEKLYFKFGLYNSGLYAFKNDKRTLQFLDWHAKKLIRYGYDAPDRFMFVDQKILDFAPLLFDFFTIFKNNTYNISHWNYNKKDLSYKGKRFCFRGKKIVFFHFSQVYVKPELINEGMFSNVPLKGDLLLQRLILTYLRQLDENNHAEISKIPYQLSEHYKSTAIRTPPVDNVVSFTASEVKIITTIRLLKHLVIPENSKRKRAFELAMRSLKN